MARQAEQGWPTKIGYAAFEKYTKNIGPHFELTKTEQKLPICRKKVSHPWARLSPSLTNSSITETDVNLFEGEIIEISHRAVISMEFP